MNIDPRMIAATIGVIIGVMIGGTVIVSDACAVTMVRADGSPATRFQKWVDQKPNIPTAPGNVTVRFGSPYENSQYTTSERLIWVTTLWPFTENTFWHEMGHDYSFQRLSDDGFSQWASDMGVGIPRNYRGPYGIRVAEEYFADWYSVCATRGKYVTRYRDGTISYGYGFRAPRKRFRETCTRIWRYV